MKGIEIQAIAENDGSSWWCLALPTGPARGLFAIGETFRQARRNLAEVVLEQLNSNGTTVEAVRIFCITHKTFKVADDGGLKP